MTPLTHDLAGLAVGIVLVVLLVCAIDLLVELVQPTEERP